VGWARANLIYDKYVGLPEYGSLLETLMVYVQQRRLSIRVAQTRAQAQAALGGEEAPEAFTSFRNLINHEQIEAKKVRLHEALEKLANMREIRFNPIGLKKEVLSKNTRRVSRDEVDRKLNGLKPLGQVRRSLKRKRR